MGPKIILSLLISILTPLLYSYGVAKGLRNNQPLWIITKLGFRCNQIMMSITNSYLMITNSVTLVMNHEANQRKKYLDTRHILPHGVCFYGDSEFTFWYNLKKDMSFLQRPCWNSGFGGCRTIDMWNWVDLLCLRYHPSIVFLHAGGNDWDYRKQEETKDNVKKIIEYLNSSTIEKIYWLITPRRPIYSNAKWKFMLDTANHLHQLSEKYSKLHIIDLSGTIPPHCTYTLDRVHQNELGHWLVAQQIHSLMYPKSFSLKPPT